MSIDHNRIKVSDLEINQPNKTLVTNDQGELEFSDALSLFESGSGMSSIVLKNKNNNLSTGLGAVALGANSQASGVYSFTEGQNTKASGSHAHAEGNNTSATGDWSHSEGNTSKATGFGCHSQGIATEASGYASHSQGEETFAVGDHSFAGGLYSYANKECSFVYGINSIANGESTIVLGSSITGENDNTTYVDYFNIKRFSNSSSVGTLGLDVNNNVTIIPGTGMPDFKTVNGESIIGTGNIDLSNKQDISNQIEIGTSQVIPNSWHGKTVLFTANCTLTIPASLVVSFIFNGITLPGVTLTWAITVPHIWLFGTPASTSEKQIFTLTKRGATNSILLLGV